MRSPFLRSHGFGSLEEHKAHLTPAKSCILPLLLSSFHHLAVKWPLFSPYRHFFYFLYTFLSVSNGTVCPCSLPNNVHGSRVPGSSRLTDWSWFLPSPGAMQTPEAGADSTSTVPLQTSVPVQPPGSTQQVPVQPQVLPQPPPPPLPVLTSGVSSRWLVGHV